MNYATVRRACLAAIMLLTSLGIASATFIPVEDFESLTLGPIDEQSDWHAPSDESTVALDPAGGTNKVLSVVTNSTSLHHPALILDGTVRMLFLRFRYDEQLNFSVGMSGSVYPTQFGDFEAELSMTNASHELRINDGGNYDVLTLLVPNTWYNCWLLIDDLNDGTSIWLHDRAGEAATAADQLAIDDQTFFAFRDGAAGDLRSFFIKTGGGNGLIGPLYLDDIQLENTDALNLANPTAVVAAIDTPPAAPAALTAHPNPFNPQTQISFTLAEPQQIRLTIHDMTGRLVSVLADGGFEAGSQTVTWHGRSERGATLPSGTYVARLQTVEAIQTHKLMLLQ